MRSEKRSSDLTFVEVARRSQLVQCTIETLAAEGYGQASLGEIAKRAKISKSVISYHFSGKDELIRQVALEVFKTADAFITPRLHAQSNAAGMLQAFIEASVAFIDTHRLRFPS